MFLVSNLKRALYPGSLWKIGNFAQLGGILHGDICQHVAGGPPFVHTITGKLYAQSNSMHIREERESFSTHRSHYSASDTSASVASVVDLVFVRHLETVSCIRHVFNMTRRNNHSNLSKIKMPVHATVFLDCIHVPCCHVAGQITTAVPDVS